MHTIYRLPRFALGLGRAEPAMERSGDSLIIRVFDRVLDGMERARQRRHLAALDGRALSDLGIGRGEALAEADKPFWRR